LLQVQNDYLSFWVNYEVQRLGLDLDLGTMQLDESGKWIDPGPIDGKKLGPDGRPCHDAQSDDAAPVPPADAAPEELIDPVRQEQDIRREELPPLSPMPPAPDLRSRQIRYGRESVTQPPVVPPSGGRATIDYKKQGPEAGVGMNKPQPLSLGWDSPTEPELIAPTPQMARIAKTETISPKSDAPRLAPTAVSTLQLFAKPATERRTGGSPVRAGQPVSQREWKPAESK
jgi:hypothetical protein